jgi:hypothetical protein
MGESRSFVLRRADGKYYAGSHHVRSGNVVPQWNVSAKWAHQYSTEQDAVDACERLKTRFGVECAPVALSV